MTEKTHYETLGVPEDADDAAIRAAYRSKAREHHPDRGGDPTSMALVNIAHQVLSDDEARAQYDLGMASVDEEAAALVATLFTEALERVPDVRMLAWMRGKLSDMQDGAIDGQRDARAAIEVLERRRGLVRRKAGTNMLDALIDQKIAGIKRQILQGHQVLKVALAARQLLEEYEPGPAAQSPARAADPVGRVSPVWGRRPMHDTR